MNRISGFSCDLTGWRATCVALLPQERWFILGYSVPHGSDAAFNVYAKGTRGVSTANLSFSSGDGNYIGVCRFHITISESASNKLW